MMLTDLFATIDSGTRDIVAGMLMIIIVNNIVNLR